MTKPVGEYVYHASNLPDQSAGLKSIIARGLQPSADGYAGPGLYFAYEPDGGFYHVSENEATMFRVKWADLVHRFGAYPHNPEGIQRDENEIIVPGAVPADLLEVEYFPGEWWDLKSAYRASLGPLDEAKIDNSNGAGAVPYNADVDYFGLRVAMKPSTFLDLAAPLHDKDNSEMEEYIRNGGAIGAPFLDIVIPQEWDDGDFTKFAKIQGHEGRHRMKAIMAVEGDTPIEVHLFPKYYRARDLTPDFIKHLNEGIYAEKSTRLVRGPLFGTGAVSEASLGDMRAWFAGTPAPKPKPTRTADMRAHFAQEKPVAKKTVDYSKLEAPPNIKMILWKVQNNKPINRTEYMDLKTWHDRRKIFGEESSEIKVDHKARAKAWIEKVYAKYPGMWQNNHVMTWGEGDDQQLAMFELIPSMSKKDAVEVKWFQAYPLRQGVGSRAMKELQTMAQEDGIALTLYPWDKGQVSQAKLTKFYKGQGFKPTVKGAKNMMWTPESLNEAFDQPYPFKWENSDADESMDALARLPDGSNLSIMFNQDYDDDGEGIYSVEFWRNNSQEVTGEGDAQRVFATVLSAISQFVEKRNPAQLYFSANKDVDPGQKSHTRSNLYTNLVKRYARTMGYEADVSDFSGSTTYKLHRMYENINEGGWASVATQNTVITPAIIAEAVAGLHKFAEEYNAWQAKNELGLEIKIGNPKGSGTYYERDLKQDPAREYGDIDIECFIHSREGTGSAQLITQYKNAITEFTKHNRDFSSDNGTNIIMTTSAGPAQVDLIYTFNEHANWSRALSPEYRVKGVISTSLTSALAEVLNFSFSSQGVQVKTRAGRPVSFRQSKDTELKTVTTNPESWAKDMFQFYYTLANGQQYQDRLTDLDQHPGLKDEQRLADIVHSIRSLASELDRHSLLGQGALDYIPDARTLLTRVAKVYADKLEAVINSSKFDKAATPAAEEKAKKTKLMLAKYRNEITKLLLS